MALFGDGNERKQKEQEMRRLNRLPPNQSLTLKWPVLHEGPVPAFDPNRWTFTVRGLVDSELNLTYDEFIRLPRTQITSDFHCVTHWSKFDNLWEGVAFREILARVKPKPWARFLMVHAQGGYTANVPLQDLESPDVLFAWKHNGEQLSPEHGWPLRLVVPKLYAWKSVKWVSGLDFMDRDQPGFWERNGYHIYGDPWKEQRYDTD
jgi:DMSO/TMAO reductase YedYZ molybdopterin-dependent catalytic subunit